MEVPAQLAHSGAGFTTLPYAGQECVDLHALKSRLATAMIANTLKTFFIVAQVLDYIPNLAPITLSSTKKFQRSPEGTFISR